MTAFSAVVVAAGEGRRFGVGRKPFVEVRGRPLLAWALEVLREVPGRRETVLVVPPGAREAIGEAHGALLAGLGVTRLVEGGPRRQDSVQRGVLATDATSRLVLVHDGARPLVRPDDVARTVAEAARHGAAVLALPVRDTLKRADGDGFVAATPDRDGLWRAVTPQVVRRDWLLEGLARARRDGLAVSDDVAAVEATGRPVRIVVAAGESPKVTVPEDLLVVEALLAAREEGRIA